MKYSIFNNIVSVSENIDAVYNAFTDKTLFVKKGLLKKNDLLLHETALYEVLQKNGFILDEDIDELNIYKKNVVEIEDDKNSYHLLINPTVDCNFSCWYCYEKHVRSQMTEDVLNKVMLCIDKILEQRKLLQISFFGGEPLMFFRQVIIPLLEHVKAMSNLTECSYFVNMTSNGFLFNEERIKTLKQYNFNGVQITLDGDRTHHNKVRYNKNGIGSYDKIILNIKDLVKNKIPVTLRINCTHENINSLSEIASSFDDLNQLDKYYLRIDLQVVWQEVKQDCLVELMDNIIDSFYNKGILATKMSFRDFCYADKRNSCLINYNGDIFKCTAIDFENTPRDGYLKDDGSIIWENDSLERRISSKFRNKPCLSCRILPLCHGGCSKFTLRDSEYCLYNYDEKRKDKVVLNRIEYNIANQQKRL